MPIVNTCLCPSKDETAPGGDGPEEESTAREESNSDGSAFSMNNGALDHLLQRGGLTCSGYSISDQHEEDEDMGDEVLDEDYV